jgi:hypothetical protein
MPAGDSYDSVPVRVKRDDTQGMYRVGLVIDNAFVEFAAVKTGHVDELVERAREQAEAEPQPEQ